MALMCLELCQEASYSGRLEDVGGTACEAAYTEALLAQAYDTVRLVVSGMARCARPQRGARCVLYCACTNASCARGCAAFEGPLEDGSCHGVSESIILVAGRYSLVPCDDTDGKRFYLLVRSRHTVANQVSSILSKTGRASRRALVSRRWV